MEKFSAWVTHIFYGPLSAIFDPINQALAAISSPIIWKICSVGLFVGAMIWVFTLKKAYVNIDRPNEHFWSDLRLWTIVSMLPHVIVYLYF